MKRHAVADEQLEPRPTLHAAFYGHALRLQGLSRQEAARLVIARYPHTAPLLRRLANNEKEKSRDEREPNIHAR